MASGQLFGGVRPSAMKANRRKDSRLRGVSSADRIGRGTSRPGPATASSDMVTVQPSALGVISMSTSASPVGHARARSFNRHGGVYSMELVVSLISSGQEPTE